MREKFERRLLFETFKNEDEFFPDDVFAILDEVFADVDAVLSGP